MASMERFSKQLIEVAERLADVTDAVQGRGIRRRGLPVSWLLLPAAGAGLYALGASGSLARQAKTLLDQAKERASDLPDDLIGRVQTAAGQTDHRPSNGRRPAQTPSRSGTARGKTTSRRSSSSKSKSTSSRKS
jgi:hypothetical protein